MKILKRIFSAFLCITLISGVVTSFAATDEADDFVYGKNSLGLLTALKIADYEETDLSTSITRGEFYKLAALTAGYATDTPTPGRFKNLTADSEFAGYIEALANADVLPPIKNGSIQADKEIKAHEAAVIMIKILGYDIRAEQKGGYPNGHIAVAKMLNLFAGMESEKDVVLNKGTAVQLIFNALNSKMLETTYNTSGDFSVYEGELLCYTVFKIRHIKAVVDGVDITRLMGKNDIPPFHISVGKVCMEARAIEDVYSYLGYEVDAYYRHDRGEDYGSAIFLRKTAGNKEVVIDINDISSISGRTVSYYDGDTNRKKTMSYRKGAAVILNGASTGDELNKSMITGFMGTVKLLSNSGSSAADVVFVEAYKNFIVSHVDADRYTVYNMDNPVETKELDTEKDEPFVVIYNESGEIANIGEARKNTILSIYESASDSYQKYIRAYISTNNVVGRINKITNNGKNVVIDEQQYELTKACFEKYKDIIKSGQYVKLHIDAFGKCVKVTVEANELIYGFICAAAESKEAFDEGLKFKIFTQDNEFIIVDTAKNITVDGKKYAENDPALLTMLNTAAKAMTAGVADNCFSSVVRFSLNSKGELAKLDTVLNATDSRIEEVGANRKALREDDATSDDMLFCVNNAGDDYVAGRYNIGPALPITKTATVMVYPSPLDGDTGDEEKYICTSLSTYMKNSQPYSATGFWTNKRQISANFVGYAYSEGATAVLDRFTPFSVVKEIYRGLDAKENVVDYLLLATEDGDIELPVKYEYTFDLTSEDAAKDLSLKETMTAGDLREGDVIRYETNGAGEVGVIDLHYRLDGDTGRIFLNLPYESLVAFDTDRKIRRGFVYDVLDDGMYVYYGATNRSGMEGIDFTDCEAVVGDATVIKYVKGANGNTYIKAGSMADIKSWCDTKNACSEIIIQQNFGTPEFIYIVD